MAYELALQIQRRGKVEFMAADGFHDDCISVGSGVPVALLEQLKERGIIHTFRRSD